MKESSKSEWVMLLFSLPAKSASERVVVWRKLRRFGALPLPSSGHILPAQGQNEERFQWLAKEIRKARGEALVVMVDSIAGVTSEELRGMFMRARRSEYEALAKAVSKVTTKKNASGKELASLRRVLTEISERDFFGHPLKSRVEAQLARLSPSPASDEKVKTKRRGRLQGKAWVTRHRPGIDRVACAWLIRKFIDKDAKFVFAKEPKQYRNAIPFDMFSGDGYGHVGDRCSFETLVHEFKINDRKVNAIAQAVHDADLEDEKYGRSEAVGIDKILVGWAHQGLPDEELMSRGMELIEGLYQSL